MTAVEDKILSPNDVRKLLNIDNKEIVDLCKKTAITPKRNPMGQVYFSVDEVKKLRSAKSSVISSVSSGLKSGSSKTIGNSTNVIRESQNRFAGSPNISGFGSIREGMSNISNNIESRSMKKEETLPMITKPSSQTVVNGLLETLTQMENNITDSMTKLIDEKLEGMDDVVLELVRCKTENENLKNKVNELNKENFKLKNVLSSFKPVIGSLYVKKEEENNIML